MEKVAKIVVVKEIIVEERNMSLVVYKTVKYRNISLTMWDVGGHDKIYPLWRYYFQNTQGLIFVFNNNDRDRVIKARDELHNVVLLLFANK